MYNQFIFIRLKMHLSTGLIFASMLAVSWGSKICPQDAIETTPQLCPRLPKTTHRLNTIRDLAWILTPRTYFLTAANTFTYASIYQALHSTCAPDSASLEGMRLMASYAFGDLTLSSGSKFIHLTCIPNSRGVQGVWSLVTSRLKRIPTYSMNWAGIEANLTSLAEKNPHLEDVVGEMGRLRCRPHPLCQSGSSKDFPFCSKGSDPGALEEAKWVLRWTDHISNATADASAMSLVGCVGKDGEAGAPSWGTLSTVQQQGRGPIEEVWEVMKGHGFGEGWFARQNYLGDYNN